MQKIIVYPDHNIGIECPSCDNWEEISEDHPRHKLGAFDLFHWEEDKPDTNEVSHMECLVCKHKFMLEWDYNNKIKEETNHE